MATTRSRLRILLFLVLGIAVVCAGLLGLVRYSLLAEEPDPSLVRRTAPAPVVTQIETVSTPDVPRTVQVWCAGLPNERCGEMNVFCTTPLNLVGNECHETEKEPATICYCPAGEVAIRGGGRSVRVAAGETEAWLDFRDSASLFGKVVWSGVPLAGCRVRALRIPEAMEDVTKGIVAAKGAECDEEGRFRVEGLVPGDWHLVIRSFDENDKMLTRSLLPAHLGPGANQDMGTIEFTAGGRIAGLLLDGLTGEPVKRGGVVAWRHAASGERGIPAGGGSGEEGHFLIQGLPPGTWTVMEPLSPQEAVEVEVREGETTTITIRNSDATVLEKNGFSLGEDDGGLVVLDVVPGKPADKAGLKVGDTIVGVTWMGMTLPSVLGQDGSETARFVMGTWDGPGVSLLLSRDGTPVTLALDW